MVLDDKIEIVTRVITFFFPYDSKVEEYENTEWYPGDPRDFSQGHPNGHEMWGHGQIGWWQKDEKGWHWYWDDADNMDRTTYPPNMVMSTTTRSPLLVTSSPSTEVMETYSDALLSVILGFFALLVLIAFASNILLANVIKKYRWGMKMALLFHLCVTGALLSITNSLHLLASGYHLLKRQKNSSVVLQAFAIIAWIDHVIGFALLIFVMYLAIFCFKFYWNNKDRSIEWGRSYVLYAVISTWVIAFLFAGFTAFFQCDSHINTTNQCINIVCAVSNIFSVVFTELLTRVRVVIPIIIILLILLSVRVGSSTVRRESMVKVEGADIYGDRELLLMCSMVFGIYELAIIIPQILIFFCISPLLSIAAWHFGVLFSTLATPIAVISISRNTRSRAILLYSCRGAKGKSMPAGSYAHTAKKYHESVESNKNNTKRRDSGVSFFSQESSSITSKDFNRKLSMIVEEPAGKFSTVEKVEEVMPVESIHSIHASHAVVPTPTYSKAPKLKNVVRVQSADQVARNTVDYDLSRRRMSHNDMPQVGDTDRLANMVSSKTKRFSLGGRPTVNMNLPNHIFVHHIHHENKIRPMDPSPMISMVE
ncbi:hypothetical protein GCK72_004657 [Caenorhabditis remanei]|uniref:Uncharacterized protein n=1 Tax=Caenorhabditis remanei TaxID=31234 RepID=A0A6A5HC08_CAERE|nr:hypothetical protein GCK72_004657 [Caenorhabditis remanei]KAF1764707.1 hypothetical protein GCK72_004657 [Caenorhabditis remanei]